MCVWGKRGGYGGLAPGWDRGPVRAETAFVTSRDWSSPLAAVAGAGRRCEHCMLCRWVWLGLVGGACRGGGHEVTEWEEGCTVPGIWMCDVSSPYTSGCS